ncbi:hypothetical protein MNBD_GAMMA12-855 [hydrothermal vent metagenome]|uniref:Rhs-family protein n=1 Tax=hydrothermal vent metagenome TaxID=652676 RepID=A0A3B0YZE3_9ZZZZ
MSGPSVCSGQKKITSYTYNSVGKVTQRIINGFTPQCIPVSRTFTYEYNGPINQLSKIDGPRTDVSDVSTINYYPLSHANSGFRGRIQTVTNALGITTVSAVQYSNTGKILSYVDANGITYNMTYYTGNDWLKSLTQSKAGTSTTTSWTYLNTGEVSTITQNAGTPDAMVISFGYDQARRLTRITDGTGNSIQYTLDTEGNRTATQQFDPGGILSKQLTQSFDVYNRINLTQQVNESVSQTYNTDGTTSTTTDGKSSVTQYSYDALKRLTQTVMDVNGSNTSTQNAIIKYSYDIADRLTQVIDPNNGTTTYEYDDLGNRLKTTSADTGTKVMTHDAAGNALTMTDAKGQLFTYAYDALNRLISINAPGTTDDISYVFDVCANGVLKLCSTTQGANAVSFVYDNLGSVSSHQNIAYTYDISRRIKTVTYPNSRTVLTYQYDASGRVSSLSVNVGGTDTTLASNILYSPFGPIKSLSYGNGKTLTQVVDQAYRFSNINIIDALILNYPSYDANGNILKKTNNTTAASVIDWTYSYDPFNRLTTTGELLTALSYQYQYDKNDNRLQKTENTNTSTYGYDPNSNRLNLINTTAINRDANGNTLNLDGSNYAFNPYNRLITVTQGAAPSVTTVGQYQYNALGQRIQKIITGSAASSSYLITKKDLRKLKKALRAAKQTETLSAACTTLQTWVKNELVQYNSTPGYRSDTIQLMTQLNACVLVKPKYNSVKQRLLNDIAAGYRVTRKKLRKLKKAMRAAAKTETLSTECLTLQAWVKTELKKFKGNKQYRPNASQLMAQLTTCVLTNARYNRLKQSILTPTTTTPVDSTITFNYGLSGALLSENNNTTNVQKDYVYLNGKPLAMIVHTNNAGTITSQIYTVHNDHLGTPNAMTNSAGITVWNASYGPFGKGDPDEDVDNDGNSITLNIRFPGQYYDKESGLHYNYFRVYDPNSGRYITSDPIGLVGGFNTFGYVSGSPIRYHDSKGLKAFDSLWWVISKLTGGRSVPTKYVNIAAGIGDGISFGLTKKFRKWQGIDGGVRRCDNSYKISEIVGNFILPGAGVTKATQWFRVGKEFKIGKNWRLAPFGNRTGNKYGRWPHYHRRGTPNSSGATPPGQGIGRHRPWQSSPVDKGKWDRF